MYFFLNVSCVMLVYVFLCCYHVCWFLNGLFCHGALKLDISTLFTTFFLWTSLQFMLTMWKHFSVFVSKCYEYFYVARRTNNIIGILLSIDHCKGRMTSNKSHSEWRLSFLSHIKASLLYNWWWWDTAA